LHGIGLIHCDLKPSNILAKPVGDGQWLECKLADLGCVVEVHGPTQCIRPDSTCSTMCTARRCPRSTRIPCVLRLRKVASHRPCGAFAQSAPLPPRRPSPICIAVICRRYARGGAKSGCVGLFGDPCPDVAGSPRAHGRRGRRSLPDVGLPRSGDCVRGRWVFWRRGFVVLGVDVVRDGRAPVQSLNARVDVHELGVRLGVVQPIGHSQRPRVGSASSLPGSPTEVL
jgi:hypothetical protein